MELVSNPLSYTVSEQANKPLNQLSSLQVIQTASYFDLKPPSHKVSQQCLI